MQPLRPYVMAAILLVSVAAVALDEPQSEATVSELTREMKVKALAASFEVVVPRPDESSMTYEKELPWDLVPFQLRNDKYYSVGTAFAVSRTKLVTAFHVLGVAGLSLTFPKYYVRDADGAVFEIDRITGSDQLRDVVRFTLKNRVFDTWLDLNPAFEMNQPVFSVGNALGEGNVIRRGDLIGTIPEAVEGRWNLLKSSADVNGGNSGGPLLDQQGRVVGVVLQRNDNISLSLPVSELEALSPTAASFYLKAYMVFPVIPEQSPPKTFRFEIPLPAQYQMFGEAAVKALEAFNDGEMGLFLKEQSPDLFPAGVSSREAILDVRVSGYTEIYLKSPETRIWGFSDLKVKSSELGGNGRFLLSPVTDNLAVGKIRLPDGVAVDELFRNPKIFMDFLYKGLAINRTVGGQDIRVTSMGKPFKEEKVLDRWGRKWFQGVWLNPVSDQVTIAYTTPIPGGAAYLLREGPSSGMHEADYDARRLLDFVFVPYGGQLKHWKELMKRPELLPESFKDVRMQIEMGKVFRLESPWITLELAQKDWPIEENAWLNVGMGFSVGDDQVAWGLRSLRFEQYEKDDFFTILKHLKPFPEMDDSWNNEWNTVMRSLHPYNRHVYSDEGNSAIAMLLPAPVDNLGKADWRFTLYLSRPGTVDATQAEDDLNRLSSAISIPGAGASLKGESPMAISR